MKKFFALLAVAALAFAVGCGGETKKTPVKVEKKPDGDTTVTSETKPGEKTDSKVDEKGNAEAKPEKPAEEEPAEEEPAERPAEEKPAEEKPAEEKPAAEKPAE